jgi:hypothetical protein
MRSWTDSGEFALEPHEDAAQMRTQKQFDFEIKNIPNFTPVAINLCVENGKGGNLILWNFEPDNITRQNLDLLETGYPYPTDVLEPYQKTTIPIKQVDFYFFNGANIHAVSRQATDKEQRSTISFLMGFIDSKTVIYWT